MNNDDINKHVKRIINDQNNMPLDDFDGLSANQMELLLYHPFEDNNLINFAPKAENGIFSDSPAFLIAMDLLTLIQEGGGIKLTSKGFLPLKLVKSLYEKGYSLEDQIEEGEIEFRFEYDWLLLFVVKQLLLITEIAEVKDNTLSLTKKGSEILAQKSDYMIYFELLTAFCLGFSWASNDGFESEQIGQMGFMYVLYLLKKYGRKPLEASFYTQKYFQAFPMLQLDSDLDDDSEEEDDSELDDEPFLKSDSLLEDDADMDDDSDPDEDRMYCFELRFFDRFCQWFGLAEVEEDFSILNDEVSFEMFKKSGEVKRSRLFERIII